MDKERYIEQILQSSHELWRAIPIHGGGPVLFADGEPVCDVGANLEPGESPHQLYVQQGDESLAILLTNRRVVTGWICDQPLVACTTPDREEFRYLADVKEYAWSEVPKEEDCIDFVKTLIDETHTAHIDDLGLGDAGENADGTSQLSYTPLPKLDNNALPPEDDRDSSGF